MIEPKADPWRGYRRARTTFFVLLILLVLVFALVVPNLSNRTVRIAVIALFAGLSLPTMFVLTFTLRLWPCPRCGGSFTDSAAKWMAGLVPSRGSICAQCGLRFLEPFERT